MFGNLAIGTLVPDISTQVCSVINVAKFPLGGFDVVISYKLLLITLYVEELTVFNFDVVARPKSNALIAAFVVVDFITVVTSLTV